MSTDEELTHSDTDSDEIHPSQSRSKSLGGRRYFKCKECSEVLKSHVDFQHHLLARHDQNKPFSCDLCHKQFKNWYCFRQHSLSSGCRDKPFRCKECGKRFRYNCHLARHLLTVHGQDRPFSCDKCGVAFKVVYNLKRHQSTVHREENQSTVHREEKPFSCNQCNEKFKLKCDLQSHLRAVHSKDGSFTCNECGSIHENRRKFMAHVYRLHDQGRRFSCTECDLKFKAEGWLRNHVFRIHRTNESAAVQNVSNVEGDEILNEVKHTITENLEELARLSISVGVKSESLDGGEPSRCGPEFSGFQQDPTAASNEENQLEQASGSSICQRVETGLPVIREERTLFRCDVCNKTFKLRMRLIRHLQRKHEADCRGHGADNSAGSSNDEGNDDGNNGGPPIRGEESANFATTSSTVSRSFLTCPSCLKTFEEYRELQEHADTCEKYLLFIKNESKRSRRALKRREYGCSICDLTMFRAADLNAHLLQEHNVKFFYHLCAKSSCKK